jgi:hypothetical protein
MKRTLTLIAALIVIAGISGAATITTFIGAGAQTSWQSAVGAWTTFPFTGSSGLCLTCTSPSSPAGTTITATVSGNNNYSGNFGDLFKDVLTSGQVPNPSDPTLLALSTTTFTWSGGPMNAVGGIWDTSPVSEGGKINIVLNLVGGGTAAVATIGPINGFFGWVSSVAFTSFTLSTNNNLVDNFSRPYGVEHYNLDNLQIATVPEPATLSIVGLALFGLGAMRRYRRS